MCVYVTCEHPDPPVKTLGTSNHPDSLLRPVSSVDHRPAQESKITEKLQTYFINLINCIT